MSGLGALSKLARMLKVAGPEIKDEARRAKLDETAYEIAIGQRPSAESQRGLLDFLRNEGASPEWADEMPGAMPVRGMVKSFRAPSAEDRLWRGGSQGLKLGEPSFFTTDPNAAMWYATEGAGNNFGGLGEYALHGAKPARLRDMYRTLLEDSSLLDSPVNHPNANIWDYLYDPRVRSAVKDRGFNSAIGRDPYEMDEIEAVVSLGSDIVKPKSRRIIGYVGGPLEEVFREVTPLSDEYVQFGKTRPWSKKKHGGLIK